MNELIIEGVIGAWGDVSSAMVRDNLKGMSGDVTVHVNSVGGDVFDGLGIYNQLKRHEGKVTIVVDGLAASAASFIAMAGDEIVMGEGAQMMIHSPWTITIGNSADHAAAIKTLDSANESLLGIYLNRNDDREQVAQWLADETWFTAEEAIAAGFADREEGKAKDIRGAVPAGMYAHVPKELESNNANADEVKAKVWKSHIQGLELEIARKRVQ